MFVIKCEMRENIPLGQFKWTINYTLLKSGNICADVSKRTETAPGKVHTALRATVRYKGRT